MIDIDEARGNRVESAEREEDFTIVQIGGTRKLERLPEPLVKLNAVLLERAEDRRFTEFDHIGLCWSCSYRWASPESKGLRCYPA